MYEQSIQRAVKQAIQRAGITKHGGCHTFQHSFATHLWSKPISTGRPNEVMAILTKRVAIQP